MLHSVKDILLYIKNEIQFQRIDISLIANTRSSEIIAPEVLYKDQRVFTEALIQHPLIPTRLSNSWKFYNLLFFLYFNHPKIDLDHYSATDSLNDLNCMFLASTLDGFFEKFISESTSDRGSIEPALIDLVLINNPDIIDIV